MLEEVKSHLENVSTQIKTAIGEKFDKLDGRVIELEKAAQRGAYIPGERSDAGFETKAIKAWARSGQVEKGLSVTDDGQGVTVRSDWSNRIFELIRESSPIRQLANVQQTSSDSLEVLIDRDEPDSAWVSETGNRAKTDASFLSRQKIQVHEHYAYPEVTLQLLEDSSFNVETWLQGKIGARFGRQEAHAFVLGDGIGKPRGILSYPTVPDADFVWGADPDQYEIGAIYSGSAGQVSGSNDEIDSLINVVDALKVPYLPGASWLMTRKFRNQIRLLKDSQGRYIYQTSLDQGVPDRLLGYPVFLDEDMPQPEADEVGALFGNFREAYTVVDRIGISIQRDPITKPGWVKYYARRRTGGGLTNPEAVKALVLAAEPVTTT